jgi:hypothetical protein
VILTIYFLFLAPTIIHLNAAFDSRNITNIFLYHFSEKLY